jgi:hypothetical protein
MQRHATPCGHPFFFLNWHNCIVDALQVKANQGSSAFHRARRVCGSAKQGKEPWPPNLADDGLARPRRRRAILSALNHRRSTDHHRSEIGHSCPSRVTSVALCHRWLPIDFRCAPFATEVMRRCKMTRRANRRHSENFSSSGPGSADAVFRWCVSFASAPKLE